jgi:uncharacterized RDD family membrane protein YckC
VQRPLQFGDQPPSKVVAFDSYVLPSAAKAAARPRPQAGAAQGTRQPLRRGSRVSPDQGSLEFLPPAPAKPRTLETSVEAMIRCDAPVATPTHRAVAAAIDGSMVLIGYGAFLVAFYLLGAGFTLDKLTLGILGGMLGLMTVTYKLYWALAGTESAGMRWMRLRLVTFDGQPPEGRQLVVRFAASCMSLCTLLGQLWLLVDEESLAWQDHMSRTFPTPWELESRVFRRG